jgi:predicted transcriptional regulator
MKLGMHDENNNSHRLSKIELVAFATMNVMLLGFSSTAGRMKGDISLLCHAFGLTHNT